MINNLPETNQSHIMASKQPFKIIDIVGKLTTWSIRINKFFKHKILSKRKNALLIYQKDWAVE